MDTFCAKFWRRLVRCESAVTSDEEVGSNVSCTVQSSSFVVSLFCWASFRSLVSFIFTFDMSTLHFIDEF